jgi:hypothetical protein
MVIFFCVSISILLLLSVISVLVLLKDEEIEGSDVIDDEFQNHYYL